MKLVYNVNIRFFISSVYNLTNIDIVFIMFYSFFILRERSETTIITSPTTTIRLFLLSGLGNGGQDDEGNGQGQTHHQLQRDSSLTSR